jgi:lipoic acid synthetase
VEHGAPQPPDVQEGQKIADYVRANTIRYAVLTSVTRDDLPDGGAAHFRRVVEDLERLVPSLQIELLVPDFQGRRESIEAVVKLPIEVFAHNIETVRELYRRVRRGANYQRSLQVLRIAAALRNKQESPRIKSGIMVGLGETEDQLQRLFTDLAAVPVEILTIGQYLQPSKFNAPVHRYYEPDEYELLRERAVACGIRHVVAGPYVRSSYLAEQAYRGSLEKSV